MRIAFVGKGGSGKTTLSALFVQYLRKENPSTPILAVDADLNIHLPNLLGITADIPEKLHISHPESAEKIKDRLKGENERIKSSVHFRKTTPPTAKSNFIVIGDTMDPVLAEFGIKNGGIDLLVVGTYDADDIGASCYHNNLAILENVLSHLIDDGGALVVDMVAGVDAFANTLHAQFDLLVLVVEPTKRGIDVFDQYLSLAKDAGIGGHLVIIGNKIRNAVDEEFIKSRIPVHQLVGLLKESDYLHRKDQEGGSLDIDQLESENKKLLKDVYDRCVISRMTHQERLEKLWELHRRYVAQDSIRERLGNLTDQIDSSFNLDDHAKKKLSLRQPS